MHSSCAAHPQVACITLGICLATWVAVFAALLLMAPHLPMTAQMPRSQAVGVISLGATLMMARSPASMVRAATCGHLPLPAPHACLPLRRQSLRTERVPWASVLGAALAGCTHRPPRILETMSGRLSALSQPPLMPMQHPPRSACLPASQGRAPGAQIAVLKETDGRGPYSSLIMAVVIVKDVLVFACFAVNIETSRVVRARRPEPAAMGALQEGFVEGCSSAPQPLPRMMAV